MNLRTLKNNSGSSFNLKRKGGNMIQTYGTVQITYSLYVVVTFTG